jgi:Proliferating cell nuclear antigen, N-terminal domain
MVNFSKILKLMGRDDDITLQYEEEADQLNLVFSDPYCNGVSELGMCYTLTFTDIGYIESLPLTDFPIIPSSSSSFFYFYSRICQSSLAFL